MAETGFSPTPNRGCHIKQPKCEGLQAVISTGCVSSNYRDRARVV